MFRKWSSVRFLSVYFILRASQLKLVFSSTLGSRPLCSDGVWWRPPFPSGLTASPLCVPSHILRVVDAHEMQDAVTFCRLLPELLFMLPMKTSVIFMAGIPLKEQE